MKQEKITNLRSVAFIGYVIHVVFLFALPFTAELYANRVRNRMYTDLNYTPGYEMWESGVALGALIHALFVIVYTPLFVIGIIAIVLPYLANKKREMRLSQLFGVCLGGLTTLYAILLMFGS